MPLPFAVPFVPAIKLLALGALKTVFLIIGACFFPRWTLKLIVGGASGMILPAAQHMCDNNCMDAAAVDELGKQLSTIEEHEFSRVEARGILMGLVRKTVVSMVDTVRAIPGNLQRLWADRGVIGASLAKTSRDLFQRVTRRSTNNKRS